MPNYGNPETENTKFILKILINFNFCVIFANKYCRNENKFLVSESAKNGFFKGLGQFFKKSYF